MIRSKLKQLWQLHSHWGVREALAPSFAKRVTLTNQIALTILGICAFFLLVWLILGQWSGILLNAALVILYLLIPWLNKNYHYNLSRFLLLSAINTAVFFLVAGSGKTIDSHVSFFSLAAFPFVLYETRERLALSFGILLPITMFSVITYYDYRLLPNLFPVVPVGFNEFTYLFNFVSIILMMFYLVRATETSEKSLQRNQRFLESILRYIPLIFFAKDRMGKYVLVNQEFERIFNIKSGQVIGKRDDDVFTTLNKEFLSKYDEIVLNGENLSYREEVFIQDRKQYYHCTKFYLPDANGGSSICGLLLNVTAQVEALSLLEVERARSIYTTKMAALGEMSGGVAHEINNPLAVISLTMDQIKKYLEKDEPDPQKIIGSLEKVDRMVLKVANIIKSLRFFSRQSSDKTPLENVDLKQLLDKTLLLCQEKISSSDIKLELILPTDEAQVEGRAVEISQVFMSLILNSYDAIRRDEHVKWIKIEIAESPTSEEVEILFTDSGRGIDNSISNKIFQPFFTTKEINEGTGLGLSISKGIIESHGGKLIYNTQSPHTQFIVILPKRSRF
jgi:PAS domain S-box-containing protein